MAGLPAPPTKLDPESWRVLCQLIRRYGADEIVRSIRLHQMQSILEANLDPQEEDDAQE